MSFDTFELVAGTWIAGSVVYFGAHLLIFVCTH